MNPQDGGSCIYLKIQRSPKEGVLERETSPLQVLCSWAGDETGECAREDRKESEDLLSDSQASITSRSSGGEFLAFVNVQSSA